MTDQKKSTVLIVFAVCIAIISVFLTYKRAFIDHDFLIVDEESGLEEMEEEVVE